MAKFKKNKYLIFLFIFGINLLVGQGVRDTILSKPISSLAFITNKDKGLLETANAEINAFKQQMDGKISSMLGEKLWLNLTSPNGYFSQTLFLFSPNGTPNYDNQADARRLGSNYGLAFYGLALDTNYRLAVDDSGVFQTSITVPVGFYLNNSSVSELTFSIDHFENLDGVNVYLIDNLLNITHDLKVSNYNYTVQNTGVYDTRFELLFSRNVLAINEEQIKSDNLIISNQDEEVHFITRNGNNIRNIKGYTSSGKLIINSKQNSNHLKLKINLEKGTIIFFKVKLENGQIITKKRIKQ